MTIYVIESCCQEENQVFWDYVPAETEEEAVSKWERVRDDYATICNTWPIDQFCMRLNGWVGEALKAWFDPDSAALAWEIFVKENVDEADDDSITVPAQENAEPAGWDPEPKLQFEPDNALLLVADSWELLRKVDVFRLFDTYQDHTEPLLSRLTEKRPDLKHAAQDAIVAVIEANNATA